MPKFLVHIEQAGEGCDHTIGCGDVVKMLVAASVDEAAQEVLSADGFGDPAAYGPASSWHPLKAVTTYEVADVTRVDLAAHWRACEEREAAARREAATAAERAEYERLRAKYGQGG